MLDVGEVFEPLCPELAPGKRFMDHFSEWVTFFEKPQGMKPEDWTDTLDEAVDRARQLTDHVSIFSDASSTKKDRLQAASAAFIEHRGEDLIRIKCPTGRATAPDAELFAIHLGLLRCLRLEDVETILVFTDSVASARTVVDPSTHSGQLQSLAVIWALIPWLEADPLHKVQFWYVPSQVRWDNHGEVHKYVTRTVGKVTVTPATRTTLNFCREKSSAQNLD
jgi:ribonuclease HI